MAVPGSVELSEITSSALFVAAQQYLRRFPQLQNVPTWALSALWALVSVIIIGYEWTPNAGGGGVLTITIPSLAAAIMGFWKLGEQFALNEILLGGSKILGRTATGQKAALPGQPSVPPGQPPLPPSKWEQK